MYVFFMVVDWIAYTVQKQQQPALASAIAQHSDCSILERLFITCMLKYALAESEIKSLSPYLISTHSIFCLPTYHLLILCSFVRFFSDMLGNVFRSSWVCWCFCWFFFISRFVDSFTLLHCACAFVYVFFSHSVRARVRLSELSLWFLFVHKSPEIV